MKKEFKLIEKINEIYHDIEGEDYSNKHDEIFNEEVNRWNKISNKYLKDFKGNKTILDYGCGTGFVSSVISNFMNKNDNLILADISNVMLDVAEKNLKSKKYIFNIDRVKISKEIDILDNSVDFILLNSVLHHVPNLEKLFFQFNKILKKDGLIIIAHEPNSYFSRNLFYWYNYQFFNLLFRPKFVFVSSLKRIGFFKKTKSKDITKITKKVNKELIKEKLIKVPLTYERIMSYVDFHSPNVSEKPRVKGFDIRNVQKKYLKNYHIIDFKTYNFISKVSNFNIFTQKINNLLSKIDKEKGALFYVIYKKNGE